ncbi:MAG: TRAP transporter TatT component family protein [Thermodesulfobacteriota bacterium]
MRRIPPAVFLSLLVFLGAGCASMALRLTPSLLENMTGALFEECDSGLAQQAIPANLKILEGLLKSDPGNRRTLASLSMGFGGYAFLFLEDDAPERASRLYLRSRAYAVQALGARGEALRDQDARAEGVRRAVQGLNRSDLEALFWLTFSWNAWTRLNLDKPSAIAQMDASQSCLQRVLEVDEAYFHGAPHILQGALLAARPPLLGGNPAQARGHFQKAMDLSRGKFFLAQFYYARYYAVAVQDRALFLRLLREILEGNPQELKGACLINTVIQGKAMHLAEQVDELFY